MDSIYVIDEEKWKDLMARMKLLGYESITVGFSGGHDEGYCDSITAKIGEGHKTFKEGTMLGEGHYEEPDKKGSWIPLNNLELLLEDFKLLTGTNDYDDDNSTPTSKWVQEDGKMKLITLEAKDPRLVNLFAKQIYAEYHGFATESSVSGYVQVDAIKGTVIFDDNWQDWVNKSTEISQRWA